MREPTGERRCVSALQSQTTRLHNAGNPIYTHTHLNTCTHTMLMVSLQGQNGSREWSSVSHIPPPPPPSCCATWEPRLPGTALTERENGGLENKCFGRGGVIQTECRSAKSLTCPAAHHNDRMEEGEKLMGGVFSGYPLSPITPYCKHGFMLIHEWN